MKTTAYYRVFLKDQDRCGDRHDLYVAVHGGTGHVNDFNVLAKRIKQHGLGDKRIIQVLMEAESTYMYFKHKGSKTCI